MADQNQQNTDKRADPSHDLKQQKPQGNTTADLSDEDNPQKTQKLADPDDEHDLDREQEQHSGASS